MGVMVEKGLDGKPTIKVLVKFMWGDNLGGFRSCPVLERVVFFQQCDPDPTFKEVCAMLQGFCKPEEILSWDIIAPIDDEPLTIDERMMVDAKILANLYVCEKAVAFAVLKAVKGNYWDASDALLKEFSLRKK